MREVESFFGQNKIFELKLRIPLHGNWNRFYLSVSIVNMSNIILKLYLTNGYHVAVVLFSNRSNVR